MDGDDAAAPATQAAGASLSFAERMKQKAKKASDALLDEFLMPEETASSQSSRQARRPVTFALHVPVIASYNTDTCKSSCCRRRRLIRGCTDLMAVHQWT